MKKNKKGAKGFTVVELMVVVGFFVIMSSMIIVGVNKFSQDVLLSDLAYDIALTLRQAQTYGVSSKERKISDTQKVFNSGYGVRFALDNNKQFVMFADDKDTNGYNKKCGFNASIASCQTSKEFLKKYLIGKGNYISNFCVVKQNNQTICRGNSGGSYYLDITFLRPNPEPFIRTDKTQVDSNDIPISDSYKSAFIEVSSPQGKSKLISVSSTGFISVQDGIYTAAQEVEEI